MRRAALAGVQGHVPWWNSGAGCCGSLELSCPSAVDLWWASTACLHNVHSTAACAVLVRWSTRLSTLRGVCGVLLLLPLLLCWLWCLCWHRMLTVLLLLLLVCLCPRSACRTTTATLVGCTRVPMVMWRRPTSCQPPSNSWTPTRSVAQETAAAAAAGRKSHTAWPAADVTWHTALALACSTVALPW